MRTHLTIGAAPGPRSPGRCSLQVSFEPGPGSTSLLLQRVEDVADGAHQPSHVGLALREQLWAGGGKELRLNPFHTAAPSPPAVRMLCLIPWPGYDRNAPCQAMGT